ncbi:MAG TPA: ABC transporter permease [Gemmatimonadaceae bacterium]
MRFPEAVKAASRGLARNKRSTMLTILCIAMGVMASATALSLAWTVTLRPLPFPNGERMVRVWLSSAESPRLDMSIPDLADIQSSVTAFEQLQGTARVRFVALFGDGAARLRGEAVMPGYFPFLGVSAGQGRVFSDEDHASGAGRVALISHATWRRFYGSDPAVIGKTLRSERATFEIVGVMPAGFQGSIENDVVEFWIPLSQYVPSRMLQERMTRQSWAIGLLRPGVTIDDARLQLQRLGAELRQRHGALYQHMTLGAEPFAENWRGGIRGSAILLLLAAIALLAIAVVNVAGMSLARALDRRREFALRLALGAEGRQIAAMPFLEATIASSLGSALGAALSPQLLNGLLAIAPIALPSYLRPEITGVLVWAVAAICAVAAMATGLLPALEARKAAPASVLNDGSRTQVGSRHSARTGRILVTAQIALSTGLVVVVALLGRSFQVLNSTPLGFNTDIARLAVTASPSDLSGNPVAFRARLTEELRRQPGVTGVGLVWPTLPPWDPDRVAFMHSSLGAVEPGREPHTSVRAIDPELLRVMGIALRQGRSIELRDDATSAPVVVISESLAERLGGGAAALGSELVLTGDHAAPARAQIIGVVADVEWDGFGEQDSGRLLRWRDGDRSPRRYDAYYSIEQVPAAAALVSIAVRVTGDPARHIAALTSALGTVAPASAVHWASSMRDELALEYRSTSFALYLSSAFGLGALLLAGIGVFATLSHNVAGRLPEFAIRSALGATPADVRAGVLRSGLVVAAAGMTIGVGAAVLATRAIGNLLYGISPADPLAYGTAVVALLVISLAACWFPARRAANVDPIRSLRGG